MTEGIILFVAVIFGCSIGGEKSGEERVIDEVCILYFSSNFKIKQHNGVRCTSLSVSREGEQ